MDQKIKTNKIILDLWPEGGKEYWELRAIYEETPESLEKFTDKELFLKYKNESFICRSHRDLKRGIKIPKTNPKPKSYPYLGYSPSAKLDISDMEVLWENGCEITLRLFYFYNELTDVIEKHYATPSVYKLLKLTNNPNVFLELSCGDIKRNVIYDDNIEYTHKPPKRLPLDKLDTAGDTRQWMIYKSIL